MNDLRVLPPLPPTVRILTTAESTMLDDRFPAARRDPDQCPTCRGTRQFRWYVPGSGRREIDTFSCDCRSQYILGRFLWHCGVMPKWQGYDWEDLTHFPAPAAEKIFDYLSDVEDCVRRGRGLTISGNRGTGKTLLAHLIVKDMIAKGVECYATSYTQMVDTYADGWRDKALAQWFNRRLRDVPVLFIDDLGRERNKGAGSVSDNMLETVIRHRLGCLMPTIITTNIEHNQIGDAYGGHTAGLLSEASIDVFVEAPNVRPQMTEREEELRRQGLMRPVVL